MVLYAFDDTESEDFCVFASGKRTSNYLLLCLLYDIKEFLLSLCGNTNWKSKLLGRVKKDPGLFMIASLMNLYDRRNIE